ncbi:MAG: DUF4442 domain-containing protein, partial [Longimicrobiales bacterium]|nr:DUF4442 domain-containing protein [Longimicrobiales bacterium]
MIGPLFSILHGRHVPPSKEAPAQRIQSLWRKLSPLPGGKWIFSRILGFMVPYSGTVGATVQELEPGHVRVRVRERRRIRNH